VSQVYLEVERGLVVAGVRPSALQSITPESLPGLMQSLAASGVVVIPLGQTARAQGYQSASRPLEPGESWDYRCAITRREHAPEWADAWGRSDNDTIGRLLGYPDCCRAFFERVWVGERWMDTTYPMSETSPARVGINPLWRWHGVRSVSHLPCAFDCQPSIHLGDRALDVMAVKWPEEAVWMREILSWPVKWTALHGIAEITTPIHRTSVPTDATETRLEVRYLGTGYPAEGVRGSAFPHRTSTVGTTSTCHEPAAVAKPLNVVRLANPADNGFTSRAAMDTAHRGILRVAGHGPYGSVLDLGCGDGSLLRKIPARRRVGIEADSARARHAQDLDRVIEGDCTDRALLTRILDEERPDLIIAQRDRNPPETLSGWRVVSYSYEPNAAPPALVEPDDGLELRQHRA
jgi:hypothetical protein